MHLQPFFEKYPYHGDKLAEIYFENGLCLPSGLNTANEEKQRISTVIIKLFHQ
jgi:dTDP-4-amino-4,6-dideoxygalactose transaminase